MTPAINPAPPHADHGKPSVNGVMHALARKASLLRLEGFVDSALRVEAKIERIYATAGSAEERLEEAESRGAEEADELHTERRLSEEAYHWAYDFHKDGPDPMNHPEVVEARNRNDKAKEALTEAMKWEM